MTGILFNGCEVGGYRNRDGWLPKFGWPEAARMQFGKGGLVIAKEGNYRTAFVEVFMDDPDPRFLRGEGATVDAAEQNAWERLTKWRACEHEWVRRDGGQEGSTDTCGRCTKCGQVQTSLFPPMTRCRVCDTPTSAKSDRNLAWLCEYHGHWTVLERELWTESQWLQQMKELANRPISDMLGLEEQVWSFLHGKWGQRPSDIPSLMDLYRERYARGS